MMRTITVRIHVHLDGDADVPPLAEVLLDVTRHVDQQRLKIPRNAVAYCLGTSWPPPPGNKRAAPPVHMLLASCLYLLARAFHH
jgi:hypothetical protein